MKPLTMRLLPVGSLAMLLWACGGSEAPVLAELRSPEPRLARIALLPALDVGGLLDASLADRMVIDEILVNLSDARLLGANPAIPVGGLPLLHGDRVVEQLLGTELPFPAALANDESLAAYVRVGTSKNLGGASVVVKARFFPKPIDTGAAPLTAGGGDDEAPDPDGDPAIDRGAPDPDGDPAVISHSGRCAPDPDGDPARPCPRELRYARQALITRGQGLPFELRGDDQVDLVVGFHEQNELNVILGIPAARWFTPEAIAALETALAARGAAPAQVTAGGPEPEPRALVLGEDSFGHPQDGELREDGQATKDNYRLLPEGSGDPSSLRGL